MSVLKISYAQISFSVVYLKLENLSYNKLCLENVHTVDENITGGTKMRNN